ncbi:hypothetical protein, partial [Variovorax sp. LjRoot178]|uniref:hypothetical protein n=1 Tax=Variovorax sp. LjRoot178 TaxID=3342277 RepID=UPI003F51357A
TYPHFAFFSHRGNQETCVTGSVKGPERIPSETSPLMSDRDNTLAHGTNHRRTTLRDGVASLLDAGVRVDPSETVTLNHQLRPTKQDANCRRASES